MVLHLYSEAIASPRGDLARRRDDPPGFAVETVPSPCPVAKYRPLRRVVQEHGYARRAARWLAGFRPDVVLSGNCGPAVQHVLRRESAARGAAFVYWLQDLHAFALDRFLRRSAPWLAGPASRAAARFEFAAMGASDTVVAVTEDFVPILTAGGVPSERIAVIGNWAPLDRPPSESDAEAWRRAHGLSGRFVYLYSGTLGLKHDPGKLVALARHFRDDPAVAVAVASEGPGRDFLERAKAREGLDNLVLMDFASFARLPAMQAAADVLVAVLDPYAGVYSVPSKVWSYLCAGRSVLAAIPAANQAARVLEAANAGTVVDPGDDAAFLDAASRLRRDDGLRARLGRAGRAHAEQAFDIDRIGGSFVDVFRHAARRRGARVSLARPRALH